MPSVCRDSPETVILALRDYAANFGFVRHYAAYACMARQTAELRRSLLQCGVQTVDVPYRRKDAADMMLLADMFAFALDYTPPSTIVIV